MSSTTRRDLAYACARNTRMSIDKCDFVIRETLLAVTAALAAGHAVELRGHFTLLPRWRKARMARNPRTGEGVMLPVRRTAVAKFPPGYLAEKTSARREAREYITGMRGMNHPNVTIE